MMKVLIGMLLVMCAWQEALACFAASQTRILPIGILGNDIVAMHLDMRRIDGRPEQKNHEEPDGFHWAIFSQLVSFNSNSYIITKVLQSDSSTWFKTNIESGLAEIYGKGLASAKGITGIQLFTPKEISMCDFAPNCKQARLQYNADSSKLSIVSSANKTLFSITNTILSNKNTVLPYQAGTYVDEENPNPNRLFGLDLMMYYNISSTRVYMLGNRKLLVVHLGAMPFGL